MTKTLLICIFSVFLFAACEKESIDVKTPCKTVLFFIGGNNNLTYEVSEKIDAVKSAWTEIGTNPDYKLLILYTTRHEPPTLAEVGFLDGEPVLFKIKEYQNQKTSDPMLLTEVINEMKQSYQSSEYGLIIFSHGSGWLPNYSLNNPASLSRSIINDNGYEMEFLEFAEALPAGLFDYIIFEVCFMGGIEIAYQLRNKADYLLFSPAEILSPGFRDIYPDGLRFLYEGKAGLISFAKKYYDLCRLKEGLHRSATISIIKTEGLESIAEFVRQNKVSGKDIDINSLQCFDREFKNLFFDLGDYYSHLIPEIKLPTFKKMLSDQVLYQAYTDSFIGSPISQYSGLSTYVLQQQYPELNHSYTNLDWYKASN